jgi:hypothetical protein
VFANQAAPSSGVIAAIARRSASWRASWGRAPSRRRTALILENACSMGVKSGEVGRGGWQEEPVAAARRQRRQRRTQAGGLRGTPGVQHHHRSRNDRRSQHHHHRTTAQPGGSVGEGQAPVMVEGEGVGAGRPPGVIGGQPVVPGPYQPGQHDERAEEDSAPPDEEQVHGPRRSRARPGRHVTRVRGALATRGR